MILLATSSVRAPECAAAIRSAVDEEVTVVSSLRQAGLSLRDHPYSAAVIDQSLEGCEPQDASFVVQQLGMAVPVFLHFGVTGIDRVVRELRVALRRRALERNAARCDAQQTLRSELRGTLSALLLSCELALEVRNLPPLAATRLRAVHDLTRELRRAVGES